MCGRGRWRSARELTNLLPFIKSDDDVGIADVNCQKHGRNIPDIAGSANQNALAMWRDSATIGA